MNIFTILIPLQRREKSIQHTVTTHTSAPSTPCLPFPRFSQILTKAACTQNLLHFIDSDKGPTVQATVFLSFQLRTLFIYLIIFFIKHKTLQCSQLKIFWITDRICECIYSHGPIKTSEVNFCVCVRVYAGGGRRDIIFIYTPQ